MRKNLIISGLCFLCMWVTACTDPFAKEEFVAYDERPIGIYLENIPEYADWVTLLKKADLFNAVNMSSLKYTCFVADNAAVQAYIKGKWKSIEDITEDEAKNLLKYHIVPADYAYAALASGKLNTQTVDGDYLTVTLNENGTERYINGVKVIQPREDLALINGYVHQLESVLDPVIYTVMEMIERNPGYSIFAAGLKECGLDAYLNRKEIEVNEITLRDYKAVLVVSDSIYRARGINSLEDLKKEFPGEPTDPKSDFYRYMGFHILTGAYDFAEMTDFPEGSKGKNIETYISREFISVLDDNEQIYLCPNDPDNVQLVKGKYDISANNGFIHELTGIMPISDPMQNILVWEPTEWDEFKAAPTYQKSKLKDESDAKKKEYYWFTEQTEHVRWKTIPYKEEAVGYCSEDVDYDRFLHDDYLVTRLGPVGWIEFDTPTIMRGKYNIQMVKWAWFQESGRFQMYIDDVKFGPVIDFRSAPGTLDMGTYEFLDSGPHVFRFSVVNDNGDLRLDRFIFTPVKE